MRGVSCLYAEGFIRIATVGTVLVSFPTRSRHLFGSCAVRIYAANNLIETIQFADIARQEIQLLVTS